MDIGVRGSERERLAACVCALVFSLWLMVDRSGHAETPDTDVVEPGDQGLDHGTGYGGFAGHETGRSRSS